MSGCYKKIDKYIQWTNGVFEKYGRFVARHPLWFIGVPILVAGLLGIGLLNISSESETETLYIPVNSRTAADRDTIANLFPDKSDSNFYEQSLTTLNLYGDVIFKADDKQRDVLSSEIVNDIKTVIALVKGFQTDDNSGNQFDYSDVCAIRNGQCYVSGEFLLADSFLAEYRAKNVTYPTWRNQYGIPIDLSGILSGTVNNGVLDSVSVLYLTFHLRQSDASLSEKWERGFLNVMRNATTNVTDFAYSTSGSLDEEIQASTGSDIMLFSLTFTLMITFASLVAGGTNCVANRSYLACGGVLGVGLAILASFGILAAAGLKFVNIVGVMPFLALGVGVDSMFVIMSEWTEHHGKRTTEDQMAATLKGCGGSITIASLTDITAFFIGASSSFISIRNFSFYTAMALAFSFLSHMTFLLGCLAVHGKRVRARRHWATCLITDPPDLAEDKGRNPCFKLCCTGKVPKKREDDESVCEKLPRKCLTSTMLRHVTKVMVLVMYLTYLGVSIWGAVNLKQGLVLNQLIADDSYFNKFNEWKTQDFDSRFAVSFVFRNMDYTSGQDVTSMNDFFTKIQAEPMMKNNSLICWYHSYSVSAMFNNTRPAFINNLKSFLIQRPYLANDVEFTSDGSDILAARCYVMTSDVPDSTGQGQLMLRLRELSDESALDVFPYTPPFIFFEQYVVILPNTLQTVGIAVVCMLIITTIFMPHPLMVLLVTANMVSILVGIFGFLYLWDLTLSSITMIHLIMSVGFSVDFSVHVCHGYMTSDKETRAEKVRDALVTSAAPVINGGLSSLIGVIVLIWSEAFIFRSFLRIMVLVISFGLAHSMLLLPVLLSLIGPIKAEENKPEGGRTEL